MKIFTALAAALVLSLTLVNATTAVAVDAAPIAPAQTLA